MIMYASTKLIIFYWCSNPSSGYIFKEVEIRIWLILLNQDSTDTLWVYDLKIPTFPCSLQHYAQHLRHGNNLNVLQWMDKKCGIYKMEYYSALKTKEILLMLFNGKVNSHLTASLFFSVYPGSMIQWKDLWTERLEMHFWGFLTPWVTFVL